MKIKIILSTAITLFLFNACRDEDALVDAMSDTADYSDWTEATHSSNAEPNYDVVFNQNEVLRFDITISSTDWASMQSDLAANLSASTGGGKPGMGGMAGGGGLTTFDPIWAPCTITFKDKKWNHVGIRYKGNSSLQSAYQSGNNKLSLKLDFNQYGNDYIAVANQRFYGFKQLNLNNNFNDPTLMREKVGADLYRQFGLVAAKTSFCVVYIDHGDGPQYFGVYTLVEEVDNTVYKTQFAQTTGNLYKPDGNAASFAEGTFNSSQMYLKTNEDIADYADVNNLYTIINSTLRTSNTETWKTNLEGVFNVDVFLKYLAANNIIQNWDTYGRMTHNYYLYNNPANGLLTWIPWDNNEAFQDGKQGGTISLGMSEVTDGWPLIRYIIDQPEYLATYKTYLQKFIDEVFIPANMIYTYSTYSDLIKEYAYAEVSGYSYNTNDSDFDAGITALKTHVQTRNDLVNSYLK